MPRIFISHIHEDKLAAAALTAFLRAKLNLQPEDIFLSPSTQVQLGSEWLSAISTTLQACAVVIAIFSPQAMSRQWVHFEAGGAYFSADKSLIPLCIGGLRPHDLGRPYSNIMSANLHEFDTAEHLVTSIWKLLRPESADAPPLEYPPDDPDVRRLLAALEVWQAVNSGITQREK